MNWKKKFKHKRAAGLKVTYNTKSKELKAAEGENRVLRNLLSDREIELESATWAFKKVWDVRSKKDLVDSTYNKHKISKTKTIKRVGIISSSYYREPSGSKKGNRPA